MILRPFGAEVFECSHVREAYAVMALHGIQLVLLDISMPGTDGMESFTILKSHPEIDQSKLRIYAYTAYATPQKELDLLAAGFDGVLHKPVKNQKLIDIVLNSC